MGNVVIKAKVAIIKLINPFRIVSESFNPLYCVGEEEGEHTIVKLGAGLTTSSVPINNPSFKLSFTSFMIKISGYYFNTFLNSLKSPIRVRFTKNVGGDV